MVDATGWPLPSAERNSFVIRGYRPDDLDALKEITVICFEGVSIDHNIERKFGRFAEADWKARKARDVDDDVAAGSAGIFVWEEDGRAVGYISTRIDQHSKIGRIPNLSVLPEYRGQGAGKALMTAALDYFAEQGMLAAKIETLEQNPIGRRFYPQAGFVEVARQIHYAMPLADRKM
jgi:ribosomal protein S18 acetylase RimI-like enzyme